MRNKLDLLRQAVFGASKGSEKRKVHRLTFDKR